MNTQGAAKSLVIFCTSLCLFTAPRFSCSTTTEPSSLRSTSMEFVTFSIFTTFSPKFTILKSMVKLGATATPFWLIYDTTSWIIPATRISTVGLQSFSTTLLRISALGMRLSTSSCRIRNGRLCTGVNPLSRRRPRTARGIGVEKTPHECRSCLRKAKAIYKKTFDTLLRRHRQGIWNND